MLKRVGPVILLLLAGTALARGLTADEVFEKVRSRYARFAGIRAEFTQTACDKVNGLCKRSSGLLFLAKPDKLRMEVSSPKKQLLVSNGTALFVYEEGNKQATKQELAKGEKQTPLGDLLFGQEKSFTVAYDLTDTSETAGGHAIRLVPKDNQAPFKSTELWINPKTYACEKVRIEDLSEDHNTFELEKEKGLKQVDAKWFTFTPPAGVAIVEAQ